MTKRAVVLIGSPKGLKGSNSAEHARVLMRGTETLDWAVDWIHLHEAVATEDGIWNLLAKIETSALILFVAPLYVDGLPAPAIQAFERIAEARRPGGAADGVPRFAALIHCGFIEPVHNATAIETCRQIAEACRLEWAGALALGGGGMSSRRATSVLAEAGVALATGSPISERVRQRAERPAMPRWLYILGGNRMWRSVAMKRFKNSLSDLRATPYVDSDEPELKPRAS